MRGADAQIYCNCSRQQVAQSANSRHCNETVCCRGFSGPARHGGATPAIDPNRSFAKSLIALQQRFRAGVRHLILWHPRKSEGIA
jgi:hypothetical protein